MEGRLKDTAVNVCSGMGAICGVAGCEEANVVLHSIMGKVGLKPEKAAIKAKKTIALENKGTLVTAGEIVMKLAKENPWVLPSSIPAYLTTGRTA